MSPILQVRPKANLWELYEQDFTDGISLSPNQCQSTPYLFM